MTDTEKFVVVTPRARILYPRLFQPDTRFSNRDEAGEYKATLMLEIDESLKELMKEAGRAARSLWSEKELVWWTTLAKDPNKVHLPFYKGDEFAEKKGWEHARGKCVLRTKSQFKPLVVGPDKKDLIDPNALYGGCYVVAQVEFVPYRGNGANIPDAVTTYLRAVMKVADGERIGGMSGEQVFAGIEGGSSDEDPTGRAFDDEIPF